MSRFLALILALGLLASSASGQDDNDRHDSDRSKIKRDNVTAPGQRRDRLVPDPNPRPPPGSRPTPVPDPPKKPGKKRFW